MNPALVGLMQKYDPDAAAAEADAGSDQPFTAAVSRIKRSHSRLSIYKVYICATTRFSSVNYAADTQIKLIMTMLHGCRSLIIR
jgi:hypothetical protein